MTIAIMVARNALAMEATAPGLGLRRPDMINMMASWSRGSVADNGQVLDPTRPNAARPWPWDGRLSRCDEPVAAGDDRCALSVFRDRIGSPSEAIARPQGGQSDLSAEAPATKAEACPPSYGTPGSMVGTALSSTVNAEEIARSAFAHPTPPRPATAG
jgi:hypothetical protein